MTGLIYKNQITKGGFRKFTMMIHFKMMNELYIKSLFVEDETVKIQ